MSSATCCHLNAGTLWGMNGSFWLAALYFWHTAHLPTTSSMSTHIRGQYRLHLALALHLSLPRCPSCITGSMSGRRDAGTTSLSPNNSITLSLMKLVTDIPVRLNLGEGRRFTLWPPVSDILLQLLHYLVVRERLSLNSSSLSIVAGRFSTRLCASTSMSSGAPQSASPVMYARDSVSATYIRLTGTYLTFSVYRCNCSIILCSRGEALPIGFFRIDSRRRWSECTPMDLP